MSIKFDYQSAAHLRKLHPDLQRILLRAREKFDFIITDSTRNKAGQTAAFNGGFSTVQFGESPHNYRPCPAADCAPSPYKLYRNHIPSYIQMQLQVFKPIADELRIPIRQGLDWNRNGILTDENFHDYPHIELYPWRSFVTKKMLVV